jgi:hypothetical protein
VARRLVLDVHCGEDTSCYAVHVWMEMITCTSTLTILRTRDDDATLGYNAYMNAFLFTRALWKLLKMVF